MLPPSQLRRLRYNIPFFRLFYVVASVLCALISCSSAQSPDGILIQPFIVNDYSPDYEGRLFSGGTNSAVYRAVSRNQTAAEGVRDALQLLSTLDNVVMRRRQQEHAEACNVVYTSRWTQQFRRLTPVFQIGSVSESCNSRVDARVAVREKELPASVVRNARRIIVRARDVLYDTTLQALQSNYTGERLALPGDGNWTSGTFKLEPAVRINDGQHCVVDSASAYYRDNAWYLRSAVTNHPLQQHLADFRRHLLIEYVPVPPSIIANNSGPEDGSALRVNKTDSSMKTIHIRLSDGRLEMATALLLMWQGRGYTGTMPKDDDFSDPIMPVTQAFRENLVHIDQASDSITLSNIAILALPMVMTLVPLAFIADVTALGMLLYVVLTDVLSTIPFLVKGIELILWSSPSNEIVVSFHAGDDSLRLVEVWAVQCRGQVLFRNAGMVFVIVSIAALITGIVIEVWAKLRMSALQKKADLLHSESRKLGVYDQRDSEAKSVPGPFGSALRGLTSQGLLGRSRRNARRARNAATISTNEVPPTERVEDV